MLLERIDVSKYAIISTVTNTKIVYTGTDINVQLIEVDLVECSALIRCE